MKSWQRGMLTREHQAYRLKKMEQIATKEVTRRARDTAAIRENKRLKQIIASQAARIRELEGTIDGMSTYLPFELR